MYLHSYLLEMANDLETLNNVPIVCMFLCHILYYCTPAGKLETDGTMHVTLCDFIESWEALSATQKKSLTQRYEMGCDCKVQYGVERLLFHDFMSQNTLTTNALHNIGVLANIG